MSWARGHVDEAPPPSTTASVRETLLLLVRNDLSNHHANSNAFQKNLDACLDDITSKLKRMMSTFDDLEGSSPTNALAGNHAARSKSASFEALREELETLLDASKANKIRAEAGHAKLESSLRALEVTLDRAGPPGGGQMTTNPAVSKVSAPDLTFG